MANSVPEVSGQPAFSTRMAVASFTLTVSERARDELIQQLTKFANVKGFSVQVSHLRDARHFFVDMRRADFHVVASNPFNDPAEFDIFIYQNSKDELPATIDSFVNDIKGTIEGIQGITNAIKR
jgi:hypothetical protein